MTQPPRRLAETSASADELRIAPLEYDGNKDVVLRRQSGVSYSTRRPQEANSSMTAEDDSSMSIEYVVVLSEN